MTTLKNCQNVVITTIVTTLLSPPTPKVVVVTKRGRMTETANPRVPVTEVKKGDDSLLQKVSKLCEKTRSMKGDES